MTKIVLGLFVLIMFGACQLPSAGEVEAPNQQERLVLVVMKNKNIWGGGHKLDLTIKVRNLSGTLYTQPFNYSLRFDGAPGFEYPLSFPLALMPKQEGKHTYFIKDSDDAASAELIDLLRIYGEPSLFYVAAVGVTGAPALSE